MKGLSPGPRATSQERESQPGRAPGLRIPGVVGLKRRLVRSKGWFLFAVLGMLFLTGTLFLALFEPGLAYRITSVQTIDNTSEPFLRTLSALTAAEVTPDTKVEVFTNGENFYEAELDAIRAARRSVNLEAYIFQKGELTRRFLQALTERARDGVKVNVVIDAIGALGTELAYFEGLMKAGGRVVWYHPIRWHTWNRINNRTHREIIVVDGNVAFTGGAGFADHWLLSQDDSPRWRDTMVRIEGEAVAHLQSTFAENWVEGSGEILLGQEYFPFLRSSGTATTLVVDSTPSAGRSTRARMLFQTLIASARKSIHITSPYFLPDEGASAELARAVKERKVDLKIIVPGKEIDHQLTRRSSRALFGEILLAAGRIYEYDPSMIHTKSMIIDGLWTVMGTTNFDPRSFALNDEVNVVFRDAAVADRVERDFQIDLSRSREVTYEQWRRRPVWERMQERLGGLLMRQQ
jgi:cardiolipin synthase A/B